MLGGPRRQDSTFGAEASGDVGFDRGDVGETQRPFIEVLVGEEVRQAHVGGVVCDVHTELLQEDRGEKAGFNIHLAACWRVGMLACWRDVESWQLFTSSSFLTSQTSLPFSGLPLMLK